MTKEKAAELISENLKTVYAWALSRVSDKFDAEDLAGDIVDAAIANAEKLRSDSAFYGWFWQLARNTYKTYLAKKQKISAVPLDDAAGNIPDTVTQTDDRAENLRREIAFLSENYRRCTVDYYFNDLSVKEIAEKYALSRDMVKYYLFKTRKILKEGIPMEREFGEKSFNPVPFRFDFLCEGNVNMQLFDLLEARKLPGQIIYSTYYTPMKIEELSFELGVPTVYLEDEINILCEYKLLTRTKENKLRSKLFVFDNMFLERYYKRVYTECREPLLKMCESLRAKLPEIRKTTFGNPLYSDDLIIWNALVYIIIEGYYIAKCFQYDKATINEDDFQAFILGDTSVPEDTSLKLHLMDSWANSWDESSREKATEEKPYRERAAFILPTTQEKLEENMKKYEENGYPSAFYCAEDASSFADMMYPEIPLCAEAISIANKIGMEIARDMAPDSSLVPDAQTLNACLLWRNREVFLSFAAEVGGCTVPDEPLAGTYFFIYEKK